MTLTPDKQPSHSLQISPPKLPNGENQNLQLCYRLAINGGYNPIVDTVGDETHLSVLIIPNQRHSPNSLGYYEGLMPDR